jgi:hypothetical protein
MLIAGAGGRAALRFLEFFTVNIRNKNTRAAYARAAGAFLRWCEGQGIGELGRRPTGTCGRLRRATPTGNVASLGQATSRRSLERKNDRALRPAQ